MRNFANRQLEDVYQKVIAWSEDVDIRRVYESKLLRHAWGTLLVCATEEKEMRRERVWQVAHGMVVLNLPDELAWTICVDWKDFEVIGISMSRVS
jgi:superkiller protein 3